MEIIAHDTAARRARGRGNNEIAAEATAEFIARESSQSKTSKAEEARCHPEMKKV
jgi:hypothetical protein